MNDQEERGIAVTTSRVSVGAVVSVIAILAFLSNRFWIVFTGRCLVDSDEAVFGLMSMDVLRGHFSAFYCGQDYMGSFQSLAAAPFMLILGASPLALRVTAIVEGLVVILCWKWLLRRWGIPKAWFFFAFLFAFPPEFFATWSIRSRGGIEILLFGSLWLMVLTSITTSPKPFERETAWWLLLGILTGLSWWTNQLIVFFFIPAVLAFLLVKENRSRLIQFLRANNGAAKRVTTAAIVVLYWIAILLLIARGTAHYKSPFSRWLYEYRWLLPALYAVLLAIFLFSRKRLSVPLWPLAAGVGLLLAYLPALWRMFVHEDLYNTTGLNDLSDLPINLAGLFLMTGGSYIGLMAYNLRPLNIPSVLYVLVPCIYLTAIILAALNLYRKVIRNRRFPLGETWIVLSFIISLVLMGIIQRTYTMASHYALFSVFFLLIIAAYFLADLWTINRPVALSVALVLVCVNVLSVYRVPTVTIVKSRMVARTDADLIDFVVDKNIKATCTSLGSSSYGYWEAYRLSLEAGERIIVHPILHMPRIGRYREMLKEADRCAIIAATPDTVAKEFAAHDIPFRENRFGDLTVVWGFDKKRVDELGLISYEARLKVPKTLEARTAVESKRTGS